MNSCILKVLPGWRGGIKQMHPLNYPIFRPFSTYIKFLREGYIIPLGQKGLFCEKYNIISSGVECEYCTNSAVWIGDGAKTNYGYVYTKNKKLVRVACNRWIKRCPERIRDKDVENK